MDSTQGAVPVFFEFLVLDWVGVSDGVWSVEALAGASTGVFALAAVIFAFFAALAAAAHFFFAPLPIVRKNKRTSGTNIYKALRGIYKVLQT